MQVLKGLFISALVLGGLASTAYAQKADDFARSPLEIASEREVTIVQDSRGGEYINPTLENLAQLYWKLGVFDINDDVAIDNYLRIRECGIFTDFFNDEFEWFEIREAARKKLKVEASGYPDKYKFVMPVFLGAYDQERGGFDIINNSGFPNLKRIEFISPYISDEVCNTIVNVPDYEKNILLILDKPLDYTFVKMDDHVAQAYILRKKYEAEQQIEENVRVKRFTRQAYVRLRMTMAEYQGNVKGLNIDRLAVLYGHLDGIDVFDDPEQKLLLTSIDFNTAAVRKEEPVEAKPLSAAGE